MGGRSNIYVFYIFCSKNPCILGKPRRVGGKTPRRIPKVPEVKRLRGASEGDEETVTTALPRDDESPHNVDDKVAVFLEKRIFK